MPQQGFQQAPVVEPQRPSGCHHERWVGQKSGGEARVGVGAHGKQEAHCTLDLGHVRAAAGGRSSGAVGRCAKGKVQASAPKHAGAVARRSMHGASRCSTPLAAHLFCSANAIEASATTSGEKPCGAAGSRVACEGASRPLTSGRPGRQHEAQPPAPCAACLAPWLPSCGCLAPGWPHLLGTKLQVGAQQQHLRHRRHIAVQRCRHHVRAEGERRGEGCSDGSYGKAAALPGCVARRPPAAGLHQARAAAGWQRRAPLSCSRLKPSGGIKGPSLAYRGGGACLVK